MEKRLFEDLIDSDRVKHKTAQSKTLPVSLALHAIAASVIVVVPILASDQMPEPAAAVKAFFVEPMAAPAPPPPPPPPAPRAPDAPRIAPKPVVQNNQFVAPVDVPQQIRPEEGLDLGVQGVPGGVEGGVPGGVVGGIVGGLPDAPPPPPQQAVRVGGQIKEPKKLKNVNPTYPDIAKQARVQGVVILECTISPQGKVTDVKVLRGIPLLDQAAVDAV
ncbi:MAG: energy transducer TonB, partial [Betaproteobacteria bacterium]